MKLVLKSGDDVGISGHFLQIKIFSWRGSLCAIKKCTRYFGAPSVENEDYQSPIAAAVEHANDSRDVLERLADFAQRGADAPESLTPYEIRQVSFALSLFIATREKS